MINKQEVIEQIYDDWGQRPESGICISILDYLLSSLDRNLSHITYGNLRKVVGKSYDDKEILSAVQYLCGDKLHLLDTKFELIEDENFIDVSKSDMHSATATGKLCHPETGELISNFEERVFIYFQPGSFLKKIL